MKRLFVDKYRIYFSRWSKKGYAVFAGLGKEIRIAVLAVHICACALLKSASKGLVVNTDKCAEDNLFACFRFQADVCAFLASVGINRGEVCPDTNNKQWI